MQKLVYIILLLNFIYSRECFILHDGIEQRNRPIKDTYTISPSSHFYIHFDTTGIATPSLSDLDLNGVPDYIDQVAMIADSAHQVLVNIMGWQEEPFDGDGGYDIYVMSYPPGIYGYNYPDNGGTSWLQIDNDYLGYSSSFDITTLELMQTTVAHEYFHAIQWGYEENLGNNAYFYEMTSMWFEDILVPDGNDYLDGWTDRLFNNPTLPFNATPAQGRKGYELALFGHYLSNYLDLKGFDDVKNSTIIREIWEFYRDNNNGNNYDAFNAIQDVLEINYNTTFINSWTDFISRNLYNGLFTDIDNPYYYYIDQALIEPITSNPEILVDSQEFSLELDNNSVAIKSYHINDIFNIFDINHSNQEYIGRIAIVSNINNSLIWGQDFTELELLSDSQIHFVYGSVNEFSSVSINIDAKDESDGYNNAPVIAPVDDITVYLYAGAAPTTTGIINATDIDGDILTYDIESSNLDVLTANILTGNYFILEITAESDSQAEVIVSVSDGFDTSIENFIIYADFTWQMGDVNDDGSIDILDIVVIVNIILEGVYHPLADVTDEGSIDILDLVTLINWILYP